MTYDYVLIPGKIRGFPTDTVRIVTSRADLVLIPGKIRGFPTPLYGRGGNTTMS